MVLIGVSFVSGVAVGLLDPFEVEAVFVATQPASEGHAIAVECNDVTIDLDVPADFFTKPSCHDGAAVLFPGVKHPAHADRAVLIQSGDLALAEQLVVGFGFLGRNVDLPERRLEDSVPREFKQIPEAPFAAFVSV
jgi:hypothetical protein